MTALSARLYVDLLSKPFVEGGRGPDTYDCVGLAAELQRRLGRKLPTFLSCEAELHRQLALGGVLDPCQRLERAAPGCIAFVRMSLGAHHIGTMIDPFRMLHTTAQTRRPVIEPVLGPLWSGRILGFYTMEDR